ncbi:MAG: M56 family metallopeptidase [Planctomycetota bacterium]|jgi:beta-lactamase regulating signal transducer with metallopeptidase domain
MDILKNILSQEIIQRLGWTLVHFVWQAAAVALLLAIVLRLLHKSSANLRYIITCMALALIVLMPIVTIRLLDVPAETIEPVKLLSVDLPKAEFDVPALVEIPRLQSPPEQAAITPKVPLKDRFIEAVEPSLPFIVVGWLVGVFGLSLWHLGGWAQLQRLRRKMVKQVGERVNLRLRHLAQQLCIKRAVEIAESALVQVPAVVGWLRPVILLPASALTGLSGQQLEAILAHELAHIKRCDYLVNILQTAVEILGFYHPAVWWVSRKIRAERENCCDDLAVSVSGDRVAYARALTSMEQVRAGYTLAVAASGGGLFDRIRRLLAKDPANEAKPSWLPSAIAIVLITALVITASWALSGRHQEKTDLQLSDVRTYQVNRSVEEFPDNDFSTPEAAYAAINKIADRSDNRQWAKVSVERLAKKMLQSESGKSQPDPEWNKVLQNAQILEVRVYKKNYAMVIAKLPQEFSSKKIRSPIDIRSFELEDVKWLNAGNNRCWTVEEARALFIEACEFREEEKVKKLILEEKIEEALKNPEIIRKPARELFENIRKADYEKILSYYDEKTGRWRRDGWKKLDLDYMVKTDWPSFAVWVCRTFKDNPIVSVELGEVFISDKEISGLDRKNWPTVPYKLVLKEGGTIEGNLLFRYKPERKRSLFRTIEAYWQAMLGLDWHLQDEPIKRTDTQRETIDYSSVTVEEGVGFDDIIFGCTGDLIKSKLGEPDKEVHNEKDWWLNYRKTSGLGFWVNPQENFLIEIRLNKGFKGKLTSGISMVSTKEEVFDVYGKPIKEETVEDFDERYDNQVLLQRSGLLGRFKPTKIYYDKDGLLFWFDGDEIEQIVVYRKSSRMPEQIESFKRQLQEPVTVHIDHSPENDKLSVQDAVMAVCKAAGVPYNWDKSAELAEPQRRRYIEPVNIENNVASQAIADMLGPVGLLYGVDADGVYLYKPEKTPEIQSHLEILNIELEPVTQGKNVIYATVENTSSKEQLFAIHIYTRSVDYGPHGIGWGTSFFEKLEPNETKRTRFAYKIQGPVTENTYIRVKFYNPATKEQYNYDKPFTARVYKSSDLKRKSEKKTESISKENFTEIIIGNFTKVQRFIKDKKYEQAWELFSQDYQKSEYQIRGFERFQKAMEPKHLLSSAFTWEKSQFLKLKPKQLENNDSVTLLATYKKETWKISFVKEADQWKIDDIVGYRPRILDIQEADNK